MHTYNKLRFTLLFFALLLLCLAQPQARAQQIIYTTGFENAQQRQGWGADNGVWQIGTPPKTSGPGSAYEGTVCAGTAMTAGTYPINVSSRLISPKIDLSTYVGQQINVTFLQWFEWDRTSGYDGYTAGTGDVQVSTWNGTAWGTWTTASNPTGGSNNLYNTTSGGWSLASVDLSAYAGQQIRLGFQHNGASFTDPGWYIDDVTVAIPASPHLPLNQTIGFENFTPSNWQGWHADNGVWQIGAPPSTSGPGVAWDGLQCAGTSIALGGYPEWTSSRLITPPISLPSVSAAAGQHIYMTFWQWFLWSPNDTDGLDNGAVQVSTWTNGAWSAWQTGPTYTQNSFGWAFVGTFYTPIDLTAYAGQLIQIGFQQNSFLNEYNIYPYTNTYPGWYIDDVTITLPAPILISFSPTQGSIGTSVTLTGNFLDGASAVTFNGASASFTFVSSTTITTTVPVGATTGPIAVTTPIGTATSSQNFTVLPTAKPQTVSVAHNTAKPITLTGTDPNNLRLTFKTGTPPTNGSLSPIDSVSGAITYTPNNNFQGTDSFTFTVNDGTNTSAPATVTLNVAPGTPTAKPQTVAVDLGAPTAISLIGTDPDNPPLALTYTITTSPTNGGLSGLNSATGTVTYTPNAGFKGKDSFAFTVSNGTNISTPAAVTLNVAVGTPTAYPQTISVSQNTATAIGLMGTDPDDPPLALTFAIAASPKHGVLSDFSSSTGDVTYTPNNDFQGNDTFTFTVNNGTKTSAAATVTLNVAAGTPVANPQTVAVAHNTTKAIALTGTDPDNPALKLTFAIASQPSHGKLGTLNAATGAVTYTPTNNFQGKDAFTFTVSNGTNTSAAATVTLNVTAGKPTAVAQTVAVAHNTAKSLTLTGTDPDNPAPPLTFAIVAQPAHGTLSGLNTTTGAVTYTPTNNYQGKDAFTFTVNNGTNTSTAATITLNVAPGTPTANPQTVAVAHNAIKTITLTGADPDNPALKLTFALASPPSHGVLGAINANTGVVNYEPNKNYQGADSFTFTVSNGINKSAPATVMLNIAPGTPVANAQAVTVAHNTAKAITLTGTDADTPVLSLTFAIVTQPVHGTLGTLNTTTGAVTYTPNANYGGPDSFTFTVNNGTFTSAPATVTLKVAAGTPTANAQTVNVTENTAVSITLTGTDPDNPALPLTFAIAAGPKHGTLGTLNATTGVVTYTPAANYTGADSFTFTVSNGTNKSAPATVTLDVSSGGGG